MDHSLFGEGLSAVALLAIFFAPIAWMERDAIRAWWDDLMRDIAR